MHGSGLTPNVVATDLESAVSSAQSLLVHTPLLQLARRVAILRALGKSEVHCLHLGSGEQITGSLRPALRWESHKQGWFEVRFILKVRHTMVHDAEYEELLWIVSHKLSDSFYAYQSLCGFPMAMLAYSQASPRSPHPQTECGAAPKSTTTKGIHSHTRQRDGYQNPKWYSVQSIRYSISSEKGSVGIVYTSERVRPCSEYSSYC